MIIGSAARVVPLRYLRLLRSPAAVDYIISDFARRHLVEPVSVCLHLLALILYRLGIRDPATALLMYAHRGAPTERITASVVKYRESVIQYSKRYVKNLPPNPRWKQRCLVLRLPDPDDARLQPGVLLINFSRAFGTVAALLDLSCLQQHYQVVLEPSWAGYCTPDVMAWCNSGRAVIVQSSAESDRHLLQRLGTNLVPVEFGASDWVDHRVFRPLELEKVFDSIYVANLTKNKRIHAYLRAVASAVRIEPKYRGALVCSSWGGQRGTLEALLDFYGVRAFVHVYHQLSQSELNEMLNRSKANVLMSIKEGSNKSLFESMFAGTPVLALRENSSINHAYINEQTGMLVNESAVVSALLQLRTEWDRYRPRQWAMENISPQETTRKLESSLQVAERLTETGRHLLVKVNSPEACYWDADVGRALPSIDEIFRPFRNDDSGAPNGDRRRVTTAPEAAASGEGR